MNNKAGQSMANPSCLTWGVDAVAKPKIAIYNQLLYALKATVKLDKMDTVVEYVYPGTPWTLSYDLSVIKSIELYLYINPVNGDGDAQTVYIREDGGIFENVVACVNTFYSFSNTYSAVMVKCVPDLTFGARLYCCFSFPAIGVYPSPFVQRPEYASTPVRNRLETGIYMNNVYVDPNPDNNLPVKQLAYGCDGTYYSKTDDKAGIQKGSFLPWMRININRNEYTVPMLPPVTTIPQYLTVPLTSVTTGLPSDQYCVKCSGYTSPHVDYAIWVSYDIMYIAAGIPGGGSLISVNLNGSLIHTLNYVATTTSPYPIVQFNGHVDPTQFFVKNNGNYGVGLPAPISPGWTFTASFTAQGIGLITLSIPDISGDTVVQNGIFTMAIKVATGGAFQVLIYAPDNTDFGKPASTTLPPGSFLSYVYNASAELTQVATNTDTLDTPKTFLGSESGVYIVARPETVYTLATGGQLGNPDYPPKRTLVLPAIKDFLTSASPLGSFGLQAVFTTNLPNVYIRQAPQVIVTCNVLGKTQLYPTSSRPAVFMTDEPFSMLPLDLSHPYTNTYTFNPTYDAVSVIQIATPTPTPEHQFVTVTLPMQTLFAATLNQTLAGNAVTVTSLSDGLFTPVSILIHLGTADLPLPLADSKAYIQNVCGVRGFMDCRDIGPNLYPFGIGYFSATFGAPCEQSCGLGALNTADFADCATMIETLCKNAPPTALECACVNYGTSDVPMLYYQDGTNQTLLSYKAFQQLYSKAFGQDSNQPLPDVLTTSLNCWWPGCNATGAMVNIYGADAPLPSTACTDEDVVSNCFAAIKNITADPRSTVKTITENCGTPVSPPLPYFPPIPPGPGPGPNPSPGPGPNPNPPNPLQPFTPIPAPAPPIPPLPKWLIPALIGGAVLVVVIAALLAVRLIPGAPMNR